MLTPFGLQLRKMRLDKNQTKLLDMANDLAVSSSYLSAVEHGKKSISGAFVKKVHLYFRGQGMTLKDWEKLAANSQPQMKLDLTDSRETKLAFGRKFDGLPNKKKDLIRRLLEEGDDKN